MSGNVTVAQRLKVVKEGTGSAVVAGENHIITGIVPAPGLGKDGDTATDSKGRQHIKSTPTMAWEKFDASLPGCWAIGSGITTGTRRGPKVVHYDEAMQLVGYGDSRGNSWGVIGNLSSEGSKPVNAGIFYSGTDRWDAEEYAENALVYDNFGYIATKTTDGNNNVEVLRTLNDGSYNFFSFTGGTSGPLPMFDPTMYASQATMAMLRPGIAVVAYSTYQDSWNEELGQSVGRNAYQVTILELSTNTVLATQTVQNSGLLPYGERQEYDDGKIVVLDEQTFALTLSGRYNSSGATQANAVVACRFDDNYVLAAGPLHSVGKQQGDDFLDGSYASGQVSANRLLIVQMNKNQSSNYLRGTLLQVDGNLSVSEVSVNDTIGHGGAYALDAVPEGDWVASPYPAMAMTQGAGVFLTQHTDGDSPFVMIPITVTGDTIRAGKSYFNPWGIENSDLCVHQFGDYVVVTDDDNDWLLTFRDNTQIGVSSWHCPTAGKEKVLDGAPDDTGSNDVDNYTVGAKTTTLTLDGPASYIGYGWRASDSIKTTELRIFSYDLDNAKNVMTYDGLFQNFKRDFPAWPLSTMMWNITGNQARFALDYEAGTMRQLNCTHRLLDMNADTVMKLRPTTGDYVRVTCDNQELHTTWTFDEAYDPQAYAAFVPQDMTLALVGGGNWTHDWPANVVWPDGTPPTFQTHDGVDWLAFKRVLGGDWLVTKLGSKPPTY